MRKDYTILNGKQLTPTFISHLKECNPELNTQSLFDKWLNAPECINLIWEISDEEATLYPREGKYVGYFIFDTMLEEVANISVAYIKEDFTCNGIDRTMLKQLRSTLLSIYETSALAFSFNDTVSDGHKEMIISLLGAKSNSSAYFFEEVY